MVLLKNHTLDQILKIIKFMKNLKMFCITLEPSHIDLIKSLDYDPVVLGEKPSINCFGDKTGENISSKNKYYGEYTFQYYRLKLF